MLTGTRPAPLPKGNAVAATDTALTGAPRALGEPVALTAVLALAAISSSWGLGHVALEPYYAAAARSMSMSWHNFFFGSFDPAATVMLDKLPGAFWAQAASVRIFGLHTWSLALPQVIEGVLTVLVLYRVVRRLAGAPAGLLAALVLAVSPAAVAAVRGNVSDPAMTLLAVLATDATTRAITTGNWRRLILAAFWVGLAFEAKMMVGWLILPALAVAYLSAAPGSVGRRLRHLVAAGLVCAVVSLAWMLVVTAVPSGHRPYADGSYHNSVFEQVFVYNGLGRFQEQALPQFLTSSSTGLGLRLPAAPPAGWNRLLSGPYGRDVGWLLPAALLIAAGGLLAHRRSPRTDPMRASYVLWAVWLTTLVVVFSTASHGNPYYVAALSPPIAALLGTGLVDLWRRRSATRARVLLAVGVGATAAYAAWLLPASGTGLPPWLLVAIAVAATVSVIVWAASWVDRRVMPVGIGLSVVTLLLAPTAATASIAANRLGAFDLPFQSQVTTASNRVLFGTPTGVLTVIPVLQRARAGAPDLLATQTAMLAAPYIYYSGEEVLSIGGATGRFPEPTLNQLRSQVRAGQFHAVLASISPDPRFVWIRTHCQTAAVLSATFRAYVCVPADAGPS